MKSEVHPVRPIADTGLLTITAGDVPVIRVEDVAEAQLGTKSRVSESKAPTHLDSESPPGTPRENAPTKQILGGDDEIGRQVFEIPESTQEIRSLNSQASNQLMALLRNLDGKQHLDPHAIAVDNSILRLKLWAADVRLDADFETLSYYNYDPDLFVADQSGLFDVLLRTRELRRALSVDGPCDAQEIEEAVEEMQQAVASLTSSTAAHRALWDLHGEVAALRARLRALEGASDRLHGHSKG